MKIDYFTNKPASSFLPKILYQFYKLIYLQVSKHKSLSKISNKINYFDI